MGTILHGNCDACGYETTLLAGGGLRDCRPETAIQASGEDPGLIEALEENRPFAISRFPALCAKCKELIVAVVVTYRAADGRKHTVHASCPECGKRPVLYPPRAEMVACPVCGKMIRLEITGHWD